MGTEQDDINRSFEKIEEETKSKQEKITELKQEYMNGQMTKDEFDRRLGSLLNEREQNKKRNFNKG